MNKHLCIPANLANLHLGEEELREKALEIVATESRLQIHLAIIEASMDLADKLRQFETIDEDLKVVQLLGMRTFNAFAASLKLALSGYGQNSALIMRDILETVFLLDLFRGDRTRVQRWALLTRRVGSRISHQSRCERHWTCAMALHRRNASRCTSYSPNLLVTPP
jgi:hypothetical protein